MLSVVQIADLLTTVTWALMRVSGVILVAPILGAVFVPARLRIVIAVVLAVAMLPAIGPLPDIAPFSIAGFLVVARELAIGVAIGFTLKLIVEASVFAGQLVAMGMGLSFATVVDPQAGSVPLLGRLYIIVATLLLLATNAHLAMIAIVAESYTLLPIGPGGLAFGGARVLVDFASVMFVGALQLSLPAVISILMVNVAFGVISRAAPTLNLFAVGFPVTLLLGMIVLVLSIGSHGPVWERQFDAALAAIGRVLAGG